MPKLGTLQSLQNTISFLTQDLQLLFLVCIHSFMDQNCTTPTNNSTENTSITLCQDSSKILKDIPLDVTKIGVLSTIIIFTVLGNLVVIIAIAARRAKMTRMYYFILHLSLADLLVRMIFSWNLSIVVHLAKNSWN